MTSPISTMSVSKCTFLANFVISTTARAKNIGKTMPTASSFLTRPVPERNSTAKTVITPNKAAPAIKSGEPTSFTIKKARTIPSKTECEIASETMDNFLSTKKGLKSAQAAAVAISTKRDS